MNASRRVIASPSDHGRVCQRAQVELDRRAHSARLGALRHLAQEDHEIDRLAGRHLAAMADHGVAEQLVGDLARQGGVAVDLVDVARSADRIVLLDRELGLRAQGGQRRADLMRGIGEKGLHQRKRGLQPLHEPVEPGQELADLGRRRGDDRRQIAGLALRDQPLDGQQRRQRPANAEPDQARRHQDDEQDRRERRWRRCPLPSARRSSRVWATTTVTQVPEDSATSRPRATARTGAPR